MAAKSTSQTPSNHPTRPRTNPDEAMASTTAEPRPEPRHAEQDATASPPVPQRHTPVTPGPRATRLQQVYAQSLRRTLSKLEWENFAECFPTAAKKAEGVLKQVHGQMVDKLGEKCEKEFDNILTSRNVVSRLNELEAVLTDASHRRASAAQTDPDILTDPPPPPHTLPPSSILSAHLRPILASHTSQLNARLQTTQSQNALLHEEVQRQREEVEELLRRLEGVVGDVRGANEALGKVVGQLSLEAREGMSIVDGTAGG